ncbi:MAG TPA: NAD(P)-binding domain-containing protein [Candidatus Limnocylindrales bacterium]|nr:NAD(P)-binding domain-containing protein [Candidatus Limnocylindrales bacterium]
MTESTGPFPPGSYPVIVIGSGPGGIQVSYALRRNGIDHAVISEDPAPGGMFRRWPHFQRLLSWTKPHAPASQGSRAYERYDWNSLLADEPEARALQPGLMDGTSYFPSRPEMEQNLALYTERAGVAIRYGCRWTATRRIDDAEGGGFAVETTDGEYRAQVLVVAVGVAEPYSPPGIGMELTHHYAEVRPAESYAGHRVLMLGKQNSGFELANGLLPWACSIALVSPSPAKFSVQTNSLAGVRARYVQPYEDFVLGGGVAVLNAALDRIERTEGGDGSLTVHLRRTDNGNELAIEVDDVISATGFVTPLLDLPDIGCSISGRSRLPLLSSWWESTTLPGVFFAGTIGQAAKGLVKHGVPANSGAVHGARYNSRVLARYMAETRFGKTIDRPSIALGDIVGVIAGELADAPELWHQRAYLARVFTVDPDAGLVDDGVQPLTHFLDDGGPNAVGVTLEADGTGAIFPVLYTRIDGDIRERAMVADPLLRYDGPEARGEIRAIVREAIPDVPAD